MAHVRDDVRTTLSLLETLRLPHPSGPLLSSFITEAIDPTLASRYVRDRLSAGDDAHSMISDWTYILESLSQNGRIPPPPDASTRHAIARRDGGRCCVTGRTGALWDPLQVMPILPVPSGWIAEKVDIFEMLGAFFGPSYRDWWLSYAKWPQHMMPMHNHWLIRKSVAKALARGFVKLDRLQPSMVEFEVKTVPIGSLEPIRVESQYALLADHSRSGIEKIDLALLALMPDSARGFGS